MEEEFNDIKAAVERARLVVNPWKTILKPSYAPQLFIAITCNPLPAGEACLAWRYSC